MNISVAQTLMSKKMLGMHLDITTDPEVEAWENVVPSPRGDTIISVTGHIRFAIQERLEEIYGPQQW